MAFRAIDSGEIPIPPLPAEPLTGVGPEGPIGPQGVQGTPGPYRNPTDAVYVQSVWAIDPVNGNDANPGTVGQPLKTAGAYFARMGGSDRPLTGLVTIELLNDLPSSDPLILSSAYLTPTAQVKVIDGNPNVLASGTLTGQVAFNSAAPPSGQLQVVTDASRVSWSSFVGKVFKITSGAAAGATATIIEDIGGGSAHVSVIGRTTPSNPSTYTAVAIQGNETYQVLERRSVGALIVDDFGPLAWWFGSSIAPPITLTGIKFPQATPQSTFWHEHGVIVANDCDVTGLNLMPNARLYANNCYSSGAVLTGIGIQGFLTEFYGWHDATAFFLSEPGSYFCTTSIYHASSINFQLGGTYEAHHEVGVYNSASFFSATYGGVIKIRHGAFGSGNMGSLFFVNGGKVLLEQCFSTGNFQCTGSGVGYQDIKFGNPTNGSAPQTQLPAMDPSTYLLTTPRALTFSNYFNTVANGGFSQTIFDPAAPSNTVQSTGF